MAANTGISEDQLPKAGSGLETASLSEREKDFVDFFLQTGGQSSSSISLTQLPGQGRCYIANEDIKEGHDLFTIPRHCLLNTRNSVLPRLCEQWEKANGKMSKAERNANHEPTMEEMEWEEQFGEDDDVIHPDEVAPPEVWSELEGWTPLILCMMWEQWRTSTQEHSQVASTLVQEAQIPSDQYQEINWKPYLDIMPKDFSNMPMFWSEADLKELKGTNVVARIGREEADKEYYDRASMFIESHKRIFFGPSADNLKGKQLTDLIDEHYSLENFHVQGSRILSRSFHVKKEDQAEVKEGQVVGADDSRGGADEDHDEEDSDDDDEEEEEEEKEDTADISMVPMADMLNASFASENARLFYHTTSLIMRSTRNIKRGEQILNTYADPPNADLLRRYGYVDQWNGGDEVEVDSSVLVDAIMQMEGHISISETTPKNAKAKARQNDLTTRIGQCVMNGLEESYVLNYCFAPSEKAPHHPEPSKPSDKEIKNAISTIDEELLSAARALILPETEWREKYLSKDKVPKPRLDEQIANFLILTFQRKLHEYQGGSSSKEDEQRIYNSTSTENLSENQRNAIIVRLGEKRVLENNIMVLERLVKIQKAEARSSGNDQNKRKGNQQQQQQSSSSKGGNKKSRR
ncbi:unnamed protein product [Sympodiomycopsis kandeliae]